jgi:PKD repeat protein
MKKITLSAFLIFMLFIAMQAKAGNPVIPLSTETASSKVVNSSQSALELSFHFGDIETFDVKTPKGIFTELRMANAYTTNRIGEPILPAQKKLIAIPFGATVNVKVNSFNVSTLDLGEQGIQNALMPLQYDIPKDMDASDVPFQYKEEAYTAKSYNQSEIAKVEILGVMRGVRIARITVEPIRYNPSANQLEVYNDIDVSLSYENADWDLTHQTFKSTYSPFFDVAYRSLLNVDDLYDDHPDLLTFPVNMLIVSDPMFTDALQPFIDWKTLEGYHITLAYTDEIGNTTDEIKTWIQDQYNTGVANGNAPDFLVFVGDVQQVPASATGSASGRKTDLYYGSVDGDMFPDIYYGRLSAQNTSQLESMLNKILYYEKYQFENPAYLDDVTLIAGWDSGNNPLYGQPTINYGTENYFNAEHGYATTNVYLQQPYTGCYDDERIRVSFINYTAHCSETVWADPELTQSAVNNFDNPNEYPIAIGNCCMSADFGFNECIGETWMRADNKGAAGYIGSSPSSYWKGDMYWSVGAYPMANNNGGGYVPTADETTMGAYDGSFGDSYYCLDAFVFVGNLAVSEVDQQGWLLDATPLYYWQAYNTIGDPSLMPYNTQGSTNIVEHDETVPIGATEYEVTAEPGSYVAISKDGILHGTGYTDDSGLATITLDPILDAGDVNIVVTKSQFVPSLEIVPAAALEGPFLTISDFIFDNGTQNVDYGTSVSVNVTVSNLGNDPSNDVTLTLSGADDYCTLSSAATVNVGTVEANGSVTIENAFSFDIADYTPDMHAVSFVIDIEGTSKEVWNSNLNFDIFAPAPDFGNYTIDDSAGDNNGRFDPGETVTFTIETLNNGHATSLDGTLAVSSPNSYITVNTASVEVGPIDAEGMQEVSFSATADASTPVGTLIDIDLNYTTGNYSAEYTIQEAVGLILEDFETGDFTQFDWQFNEHPWTIVTGDETYEGNYAAKSGSVTSNQSSVMDLDYTVAADGDLSFYYKVSSESGYDFLKFYINGELQDQWSGEVDWTLATYNLTSGEYNLKWEYAKDGSMDNGDDCGWLDYIILPSASDNTLAAGFVVDNNNPCEGETVQFTSTSNGDVTSWNWTFEGGDPATSTNENPTVTYATSGDYDVSLEVGDGTNTANMTKENFITVHHCTGIADVEASVSLYPNPNDGVFYVDIQGMNHANIKVINSVGSIVYQEDNINTDNSMKRLDLSYQAEGIYMMIVENGDQRFIEKVVIK